MEQGVVTSTVVIGNSTANFTTPDDYNVTEAGVVTFIDTDNQTLTASYNYKSYGYVEAGTTRTVIGFIPLFIALAALAIAAFLFLK